MTSLNFSVALLAAASLSACDNGGGDDASATVPDGCDLFVEPSDDDQTAVQEAFIVAESGEVVCLDEGEFSFTRQLSLDANGITVRGVGGDKSILDFTDQTNGGNGILITGDSTTFEDLQVKNTPGDGIRADQVDGISFLRTHVIWDAEASIDNGAYGLYPVQSTNVLISESLVVGARGAGVYVGQSSQIVIENSEAHGNVAGFEVENSQDAQVYGNSARDNTAGILVLNLPGLDVKDGRRTNIYDNMVVNNNIDNFAEAGTIVAMVPPGVGVLVLAADETEIGNNVISGNRSLGVVAIAYVSDLFGQPMDDEFDIYAQGTWVHDNTFEGNATDPDDFVLGVTLSSQSYDIVYDGCVDRNAEGSADALANCVSNNGGASFVRADVCAQNNGVSTDAALLTCEKTPLPRG